MITTDLNDGDMTLAASTGNPYIGEHYLDNLSVINGAALETLDAVFYNTLVIAGGTLQADNIFQQGSLKLNNPTSKMFAKVKKEFLTPQPSFKYSKRIVVKKKAEG